MAGGGLCAALWYFIVFKTDAELEAQERIKCLREVATKIGFDKNSTSYKNAHDIARKNKMCSQVYMAKGIKYNDYGRLNIHELRMLFLLTHSEKVECLSLYHNGKRDMIYKCLDKAKELKIINEEIYAGELEEFKVYKNKQLRPSSL